MIDDPSPKKASDLYRGSRQGPVYAKASTLSFAFFALAAIMMAIGMSDSIGQRWSDIARIIAVAFFVVAMVALALGMIGDAYYRNKP